MVMTDAGNHGSAISPDTKQKISEGLKEDAAGMAELEKDITIAVVERWRETKFKNNMHLIVEAQQDICGQEGNKDACVNGREIYKQMFNEEWTPSEEAA